VGGHFYNLELRSSIHSRRVSIRPNGVHRTESHYQGLELVDTPYAPGARPVCSWGTTSMLPRHDYAILRQRSCLLDRYAILKVLILDLNSFSVISETALTKGLPFSLASAVLSTNFESSLLAFMARFKSPLASAVSRM